MSADPAPIALFVEGSLGVRPARGEDPFLEIWRTLLPDALGLHPIGSVVPISKKNLVSMSPELATRSGRAIPLDELINREIERTECRLAVVVWDLVPAWNPEAEVCRWEETVELYRLLAGSAILPPHWIARAKARYDNLSQRAVPSARSRITSLQEGEVLAVCIESMFESILLVCEALLRSLLGGASKRIAGWPAWNLDSRSPDREVLQPAILAARRAYPKLPIFRQIRGDMITAKNEWGRRFLQTLLDDTPCRQQLMATPPARRLRELLDQTRRIT